MQSYLNNPVSFLNTDTEIYNTLVDAKKNGNELLKHFKILYPTKVPVEPINVIYVGRQDSDEDTGSRHNFDSKEWNVETNIYIMTKDYDHLDRYRLLKTVTFEVMDILEHSLIRDYIRIPEQQFLYNNHNIIQTSKITVITHEIMKKVEEITDEKMKICRILSNVSLEE